VLTTYTGKGQDCKIFMKENKMKTSEIHLKIFVLIDGKNSKLKPPSI